MNVTPTVRFMHLRRAQPIVRKWTDGTPFTYVDTCHYGGVTVAYRDMGDGDWQVALGQCKNDERYERKMGRDAAIHNLLTRGNIIHISEPNKRYDELIAYAYKYAKRNLCIEKKVKILHYREVAE